MKSTTIYPEISADPELLPLVGNANEILERELGPSSSLVDAIWFPAAGSDNPSVAHLIGLTLKDWTGSASTLFPREELQDPRRVASRVIRLWGDLLQVRSHKQLDSLVRDEGPPDAEQVVDQISDAIFEYAERNGREPSRLILPVRYAIALMKLGHSFWGESFQEIRESGVRAISGRSLFGVPVQVVNGVGAELSVE